MLTDEQGLVEATAYGGYSQKGKLRGLTDVFSEGTCYLYTDPVKGYNKVTDFDVRDFHIGVKEDITRYYTASLWAEVILKSYAGGGASELLWRELSRFLSLLESASESNTILVSVQFIWRYLGFLGMRPDLATCGRCGRRMGSREARHYSSHLQGVLCRDCSGDAHPLLRASAAEYLMTTAAQPVEKALQQSLSEQDRRNIKAILYRMLEDVLESRLNTLQVGGGIL
jgi:DNA repair protein RecO (recombination protein O)